ncbi:MvaI/BcnI family restriction endonuclease [Myxococcota bacterium]|nr:MvaI/BcnI family restriction endonuclease [Myxococcota bacterium]
MTLDELTTEFQLLKSKGFVKSLRKGPTGVGYTFEMLIGLRENNLALPDIKGIEIKAHRDHSNSMITLFTFNKKCWKINPLTAIKKYGSFDQNGRLGMYYTMSLSPNSAGLFLTVSQHEIAVQHISGEIIATWQIATIAERFAKKIPALIFVSAHVEERAGVEYFQFYRAQIMRETSSDLLSDLFKTGNLLVDLRLHDKGTRARNHGTGFRIFEDKLHLLFKKIEDL